MTSNLLSRLLPTNPAGRSIYDELRAHDEGSESDMEERAGLALDEENLRFRDDELGNADAFNGEDSRITTESTAFLPGERNRSHGRRVEQRGKSQGDGPKWFTQSPRLLEEEMDDDVPASLLVEDNDMPGPSSPSLPRARHPQRPPKQPAIPGPSNRETRAHWEAAQAQQRLHQENVSEGPRPPQGPGLLTGSARDKAMWRWINVTNLDDFMKQVYDYYLGAGIWCILLERTVALA